MGYDEGIKYSTILSSGEAGLEREGETVSCALASVALSRHVSASPLREAAGWEVDFPNNLNSIFPHCTRTGPSAQELEKRGFAPGQHLHHYLVPPLL